MIDNNKTYLEEWKKEVKKKVSFEIILNNIRKKKIIQILKNYESNHILEIGCGLEPLFLYIDSFQSYTIVEPSTTFCNYAKNNIKGKFENKNIIIIEGFIEDVYDSLDNYDFIILSSLLHEVPDPNGLLKAVYNICNKKTIVHVNVPNIYSIHNILGYEIGVINDLFEQNKTGKRFGRHLRFDKNRLLNILEENGFKVLEFGSSFIKPFTNKQMEKILQYKIIDTKIIEGLEKLIKYIPEFGAEIYANAQRK